MVSKLALQGSKHMIWDQIIMEADKFRPYLDFIEDQEIAMGEARKQVQIVSVEMNKRLVATIENAITFLSSLSDGSASRYGIQNRFVVISGARKVVAKHKKMEMVRAKIEVIEHKVQEFVKLFKPLVSRGLPFL